MSYVEASAMYYERTLYWCLKGTKIKWPSHNQGKQCLSRITAEFNRSTPFLKLESVCFVLIFLWIPHCFSLLFFFFCRWDKSMPMKKLLLLEVPFIVPHYNKTNWNISLETQLPWNQLPCEEKIISEGHSKVKIHRLKFGRYPSKEWHVTFFFQVWKWV